MIELKTLGRLELSGPPDRGCLAVLAQPKRLALLAYLALAPGTGFARRDTLVGLFWPELDAEHARSALRQAAKFLRHALGYDVLLSRGTDEIAVNPAAVVCDAVAFDQACDVGDLSAAIALYRGAFLEGLFVADAAPALDHWIEDTRARLEQRAGHAAWKLVGRAESEGHIELAIDRARHALALTPQDEAGLRRLMSLLHRAEDYDGAIRAYQVFRRRLLAEYEVEPSDATSALMDRIRGCIGEPGDRGQPRHAIVEQSEPLVAAPTPHAERTGSNVSVVTPAHEPTLAVVRRVRRPRYRTALQLVACAAGLSGVLFAIHSRDLVTASPARPVPDRTAHDLYVKARFAWQQETLAGLTMAAQYLEEAVRRDSNYAQAYGTLALTYAFMPGFGELAPSDAFGRAQAAAERALTLDATVADAVRAQAHLSAYFRWDWKEGDRLFRRALTLAPDDASAHTHYGDFLSATGHLEESIAQYERAKTLDPSSRRAPNNLARRLIWAGQYDRAMAELRTALALEPNFARGHRTLGVLYVQTGRYADAIVELSKARDLSRNRPFDLSALADAYVRAGRRADAERILAGLEERARREYVPPFALATVFAALGRRDEAFAWLDRAADAHDVTLAWTILHESMLDSIRTDPRFGALLRRMRLPA